MTEILRDALLDSIRMIPFLLVIYIGIELLEHKLGDDLIRRVKRAGKVAPAMGAAFGLVPQCGFSVMATALYTKRVLTVGTLLAVYLSTSDEALPVILSHPEKSGILFPLLATKFIVAVIAGYTIDFILSKPTKSPAETELCATYEIDSHEEDSLIDETGCCGHSCPPVKLDLKEVILHPLIHTLKVFLFILCASMAMNFIIFKVGEQNLSRVLLGNTILQPIIAAFIGLIPNCAASVAITEIFLRGGLSFGSTIAGLSAGAGLGILVLFRENPNLKDSLRIVGLLVSISSLAGIVIQYICNWYG